METVLKQLGIWEYKNRQIGKLSGGQLQRVLIARALAAEPRILLLDEPTANIDADAKAEIYRLLKQINRRTTIVMVSHDLEAVSSYVGRIACLNKELTCHRIPNSAAAGHQESI